MPQQLIRMGIFTTDQVLSQIIIDDPELNKSRNTKRARVEFRTDRHGVIVVKMNSLRYQTFQQSLACSRCGIVGKFFALERERKHPPNIGHFNLYALTDDGHEVLMTKDHKKPKAKGGKDHISNLETMCCICNFKKADK